MSGLIQQGSISFAGHQQQGTSSYASIQIRDAVIKFSLYIQKLLMLEELPSQQIKCYKLVRLSFETFLKYSQSEQFTKQSFQLCKSAILTKNSYYCLYIIDLMIKNSKYLIRQGRKQVESLFRSVWQRVYVEKENQEKLENLKVMVRCWGFLFGEKMEEHIRKWLQGRYGVKKIQLTEQNERAFKEVYGDKKGDSVKMSNTSGNNNIVQTSQSSKIIKQALINSLVQQNGNALNNRDQVNILQRSISKNSQSMIAEHAGEGAMMMKPQPSVNIKSSTAKQMSSSMPKKPGSNKLQGVNKSLLQALDLQ